MSSTDGIILVDGLSVHKRFPNVNLNPVVVLEDIRKIADTVRAPQAKHIELNDGPELETRQEAVEQTDHDDVQSNHDQFDENESFEHHESEPETHQSPELNESSVDIEKRSNVLPNMCEICERIFETGTQLRIHACIHIASNLYMHKLREKFIGIRRERTLKFRIRNNRYGIRRLLRQHKTKIHGQDNASEVCSDAIDTEQNLNDVVQAEHLDCIDSSKVAESAEEQNEPNSNCDESLQCEPTEIVCSSEPVSTHENEETIFKCSYNGCEQHFENQEDRSAHQKQQHNEKYVCSICKKRFMFRSVFELHQVREHSVSEPNSTFILHQNKEQGTNTQNYSCYICSAEFNLKTNLVKHIDEKHKTSENIQQRPIAQPRHTRNDQRFVPEHRNDGNQNAGAIEVKVESLLMEIDEPDTASEKFVCELCKKEFTKLRNLQAHVRRNHGPNAKKFKCKTCGLSFLYQQLKMHVETVHFNIRKHKCTTCGKFFKRGEYLKEHMRIHTGEKPFKCSFEMCGKRFISRRSKDRHELIHRVVTTYVCQVKGCRMVFKDGQKLKFHRDNEHNKSTTNYACHICSAKFNAKTELTKHIDEKHSTRPRNIQTRNTQQQPIQRNHQSVVYSQREQYNQHNVELAIKMELIESEPNECVETIVGMNEYHEIPHHTQPGEFSCHICKKELSSRRSLHDHVRRQHNARKFKCNICGRIFKQNYALRMHKKVHTGDRPYKCSYEQCDKQFVTHWNKVRHERTHSGEKPFVCEVDGCEKAFGHNQTLKLHRVKEHGISRLYYSCDFCSKVFHTKTTLMKHVVENHPTDTEK